MVAESTTGGEKTEFHHSGRQRRARVCPKCKKGHLDERVPRAAIVKYLFFWLPVKRYRCYNCYKKTYIID